MRIIRSVPRRARPPKSTLIDYIDAHREQFDIERLIREIGLAGAIRGKVKRTTIPGRGRRPAR